MSLYSRIIAHAAYVIITRTKLSANPTRALPSGWKMHNRIDHNHLLMDYIAVCGGLLIIKLPTMGL